LDESFNELAMLMEVKKDLHNIFFDNIPTRLEESHRKTI
jgi:hypothetical protein